MSTPSSQSAPSSETQQLLFIGDMHLGRIPSRLPARWDCSEELGPAAAWRRAVDLAIDHNVAAVVLAGDVVESLDDRFAALQILRPGLEKLRKYGIAVHAVVGNHDVHALPRLEDLDLGLSIIGRGGRWESVPIKSATGEPLCCLVGWSFHRERQDTSPLESLDAALMDNDVPVIGILHCDLDAGSSHYAPVRRSAFDRGPAAAACAWFFGHIHAPSREALQAERPVGYLGSLVGLDPGEPETHGPWLVRLENGRVHATQVATGPMRYQPLSLDVTSWTGQEEADLEDQFLSAYQASLVTLIETHDFSQIDACGIRLMLGGRTERPAAVRRAAHKMQDNAAFEIIESDCRFFVERIVFDVRPQIDLEKIAAGGGPLAPLASVLVVNDDMNHNHRQELKTRFLEINEEMRWHNLESDRYPRPDFDSVLSSSILSLLADLSDELDQRSGGGA